MEVDRVRMRALVDEGDSYAIPLGGAERRTGHLTVVGPGRKENSRGDLDFAIDRDQFILAKQRAVRASVLAIELRPSLFRQIGEVPGSEERRRIENPGRDAADRAHCVAAVG